MKSTSRNRVASALMLLSVLLLAAGSPSHTTGANRAVIEGRDLILDGKPYMPHGMIHVTPEQIPNLKKMGINSLSIDLAFKDFDPNKSDAENRAANADVLKQADLAHANGMTVLWLFSFHYEPDWVKERYPDIRMQKADGTEGRSGWIRVCLNHPGFRADAEKWLTFTTKMLSPHPATIGYVLWNEPHLTSDVDYNPYTIKAFREWMKSKYGTVEQINQRCATSLKVLDELIPPAPRASTHWFEVYDRMVATAGPQPTTVPSPESNSVLWMDWMRFRQENFADFWAWESAVIKRSAPDAIITSKIVAFDLYGSHAYGAGTNTEMWTNRFLDVLGMDLYPHLDENFLARWKCDYFYSLSAGKPIWHTEMNFSFAQERGLAPPEQWRASIYYQLSRGVNGFWDFMWNEGDQYTLHYSKYRPAPVTQELGRISKELEILAPVMKGMKPAAAQVAVLHSTSTGLARSGDYAPTADQTTVIDLLYRSQTPFQFVTEDMIRKGALANYRVLVAVGAVAVPDDVLQQIKAFTAENGGHVIANAGFAELDQDGQARAVHPGVWMGAQVRRSHREPREKVGMLTLKRQGRSRDDKPIDVDVTLDTYSARPIALKSGDVLGAGPLFGNEDTQLSWSSQGRHELYWEDIDVTAGGEVVGSFSDGKPAIVQTAQTLYIARDTTWVDERFEAMFRRFLASSGVVNRSTVTPVNAGADVSSIDLRMWEGQDRKLLFVVNSAPTLHYDGQPVNVDVTVDAFGDVTDALTGKVVTSRWSNFKRVVRMSLKAGEVRILLAKPYPDGWRKVSRQYEEVQRNVLPPADGYRAWRRNRDELWVQDARVELGMGTHGLTPPHVELIKKLGIHVVRYTIYWDQVERTAAPGVYDEQALRDYDATFAQAKKDGIDLLLVVHGNPPGASWENRNETYQRFANFVGMLAKRYPEVQYWELFNEMDKAFTEIFGARRESLPLFERGRQYAQMLKLAYPAIKASNDKAQVVVGGLASGEPDDFIRGIYEGGGREFYDVMNIHTYGVPVNTGMLLYGYRAKAVMSEYGDAERPLWNTEFGIDAGNMWQAWKWTTGEQFDKGHLQQWQTCIQEAKQYGIYSKILPYQFHAKNEAANGDLADAKDTISLPPGRTIDDYGIGLLRRDGATPRPTYDWLLKAQINRALIDNRQKTVDVKIPDDGSEPKGYAFERRDGKLVIKNVPIAPAGPTIVRFARPMPTQEVGECIPQKKDEKRHEQFLRDKVELLKDGPIQVVFVGDSITDGWRSGGGKVVWDKHYSKTYNALNLGLSGDRTQHVMWRLENGELDDLNPKVVVLLIGTNNLSAGSELPDIVAGVACNVRSIRAKLPHAKILLLGLFPRGESEKDEKRIKIGKINEGLADLSGRNGVTFLNISSKFLEPDGTIQKAAIPDGLHPNQRGYEIWADAMEDTLRALSK